MMEGGVIDGWRDGWEDDTEVQMSDLNPVIQG